MHSTLEPRAHGRGIELRDWANSGVALWDTPTQGLGSDRPAEIAGVHRLPTPVIYQPISDSVQAAGKHETEKSMNKKGQARHCRYGAIIHLSPSFNADSGLG